MPDESFIRVYGGKAGGQYEGRTFASLSGYHRTARALLQEAGARFMGSYLLPEGTREETDALVEKLHAAGVEDHKEVMKNRVPVPADKAKKLKVGGKFDFGGDVGKAKITGLGEVFTPEKASPADPRLDDMLGEETVYVYNANEPKAKAAEKPDA